MMRAHMAMNNKLIATGLILVCLTAAPAPVPRSVPHTEPPPPWGQLVPRPQQQPQHPTSHPAAKQPTRPIKKADEIDDTEDPQLIIRSLKAEIEQLKLTLQERNNEIDKLNAQVIEAENKLNKATTKPTTQP
jgi:hypothetical protein